MKKLKMVIPKGRICEKVVNLLEESGFKMGIDERVYRPSISDPEIEVKIMKPQNIPKLLELGSHDIGFTGLDWVLETSADVEELMDLKFDPVKIVAAVPDAMVNEIVGDLFKTNFARDRRRWLQWLFEAKNRYGSRILNYMVTSNHIHLLVVD